MKFLNIAIISCCCFVLTAFSPITAHAQASGNNIFSASLTRENIMAFLEDVKDVSIGKRPEMTHDELMDYFNSHLANKSLYKSMTRFEIPGFPAKDIEMKLGKEEYIDKIINGRETLEEFNASLEVKALEITHGGKLATIKTISTETGRMPWADQSGQTKYIPVEGHSECDQKLIVSLTGTIQMAGADCLTTISFAPFGDKPLGE